MSCFFSVFHGCHDQKLNANSPLKRTEKTAKDAMLKGDWPLSRFGLLLSNAKKQQQTTTNQLLRRHFQPVAMLLKLQVLEGQEV